MSALDIQNPAQWRGVSKCSNALKRPNRSAELIVERNVIQSYRLEAVHSQLRFKLGVIQATP